jgi:hypothetical protein
MFALQPFAKCVIVDMLWAETNSTISRLDRSATHDLLLVSLNLHVQVPDYIDIQVLLAHS